MKKKLTGNLGITTDCEFQNLEKIPEIQWNRLNHFLLSGNRISHLSRESFSYNKLKTLNLSHNVISGLSDDVFQDLDSLELINLDFNFLTDINVYSFLSAKVFSSDSLHVSIFNNPITCSCVLNAKVNTIWNKNPKIKSFFITCVPDNKPDDAVSLESYVSGQCINKDEDMDDFYHVPEFYPDEISTYSASSGTPTRVRTPPKIPDFITLLPDASRTNAGTLESKANTTAVYPYILLSTANAGVVQPWHLMVLIAVIMIMIVVVITGSYIVIKRLYSKHTSGTGSVYEGREISTATFRSSHKQSDGHFGTLNSIASQNNGYPTMNGMSGKTMPNESANTWRPSSSTEPTVNPQQTLTRTFNSGLSKSNSNIYSSSSQTLPVNTFVKMSHLSYSLEDEIAPKFIDQEDYPEFLQSGDHSAGLENSGRIPKPNQRQSYSLVPVNPDNPRCVFFMDPSDPNCLISPTSGVYYANLPFYTKDIEKTSRFC